MSADTSKDTMEFVRNFWSAMGFSLPGMVTPTFDAEELEKRITDLKAVEGWLKMNLSMLQMTIQGLEMQVTTLKAVRTMSNLGTPEATEMWKNPVGSATASATGNARPAGGEAAAGEAFAQAAMWPWNMMQQMQEKLNAQRSEGESNPSPAKSRKGGAA